MDRGFARTLRVAAGLAATALLAASCGRQGDVPPPAQTRAARADIVADLKNFSRSGDTELGEADVIAGIETSLNLIGPLLTVASFEMSAMIFYEAGLSFLGLSRGPGAENVFNGIANSASQPAAVR